MGRPKARVLPLPVSAAPKISLRPESDYNCFNICKKGRQNLWLSLGVTWTITTENNNYWIIHRLCTSFFTFKNRPKNYLQAKIYLNFDFD